MDSYSKDAKSPGGYQFAANPLFKSAEGSQAKQDPSNRSQADSTMRGTENQLSGTPMKKVTMRRVSASESPSQIGPDAQEAGVPDHSPLPEGCLADKYNVQGRYTTEFADYDSEAGSEASRSSLEDSTHALFVRNGSQELSGPILESSQQGRPARRTSGERPEVDLLVTDSREGSITERNNDRNPFDPTRSGPHSPAMSWASTSDDRFPYSNEGIRSPNTMVQEKSGKVQHLINFDEKKKFIEEAARRIKLDTGHQGGSDQHAPGNVALKQVTDESAPSPKGLSPRSPRVLFPAHDQSAVTGPEAATFAPDSRKFALASKQDPSAPTHRRIQESSWSIAASKPEGEELHRRPAFQDLEKKKEALADPPSHVRAPEVVSSTGERQPRLERSTARWTAGLVAFLAALSTLALLHRGETMIAYTYAKSALHKAHGETLDPSYKRALLAAQQQRPDHISVYSAPFLNPVQLLHVDYAALYKSLQTKAHSRWGVLQKDLALNKEAEDQGDPFDDLPDDNALKGSGPGPVKEKILKISKDEKLPMEPVVHDDLPDSDSVTSAPLHVGPEAEEGRSGRPAQTTANSKVLEAQKSAETGNFAVDPQSTHSRPMAAPLPPDIIPGNAPEGQGPTAERPPSSSSQAESKDRSQAADSTGLAEPVSQPQPAVIEEINPPLPTGAQEQQNTDDAAVGNHGHESAGGLATTNSQGQQDQELNADELGKSFQGVNALSSAWEFSKSKAVSSLERVNTVYRQLVKGGSAVLDVWLEKAIELQQSVSANLSLLAVFATSFVALMGLGICLSRAPSTSNQSSIGVPASGAGGVEGHQDSDGQGGSPGTPGRRAVPAEKGRMSPTTWLASKLTPNRISRVETDGSLEFRQLRARTIVTAKGKQVGDLDPKARLPVATRREVTDTPEPVTTKRMTRRQPTRQAKTASKYY